MPISDELRLAFEKFLLEWTARDIHYHRRAKTAGLVFGFDCFIRGYELAAKEIHNKTLAELSGSVTEALLQGEITFGAGGV